MWKNVNPDLVVRDTEGKPYTVRYDQVNAMLLNEFLKEQRKVQELEVTVAHQQKDFEATIAGLNARLKEQDSKIEKVSAQLEASKPAPQVVNNQLPDTCTETTAPRPRRTRKTKAANSAL